LLESFEQTKEKDKSKVRFTENQENIILMTNGKDNIIGGYASHGWGISEKQRGDETCFLFNLK